MSLIRRTSPFGDMLSLRQAMDHLFEDSFVRPRSFWFGDSVVLPLDVHSTPDALVVVAALPGVKPEQVEITITGDLLTISGTSDATQDGERDGYTYREIRRGDFSRSVTLPRELQTDRATASFEHGLLRLSIPRAEATRPHRIAITPTHEEPAADAPAASSAAPDVKPVADPTAAPDPDRELVAAR
ncbi:MAG TPA: Hsp20/alpha crystallin family protein [Candidatus Baltobacteraceae bacterium]|nr:Hsp20/alpha crystallin family protein [Candidatus Baltobacteraceae bacterium]